MADYAALIRPTSLGNPGWCTTFSHQFAPHPASGLPAIQNPVDSVAEGCQRWDILKGSGGLWGDATPIRRVSWEKLAVFRG